MRKPALQAGYVIGVAVMLALGRASAEEPVGIADSVVENETQSADSVSAAETAGDSEGVSGAGAVGGPRRERARSLAEEIRSLRAREERTRKLAKRHEEIADSLEDYADELEDRADDLEERLEDILEYLEEDFGRRIDGMLAEPVEPGVGGERDTVVVLSENDTPAFVESLGKLGGSAARRQGYGGALSTGPFFHFLDMEPVRELVESDPYLNDSIGFTLEDRYELVPFMGGMGYGGVGNGLRLGGGGWGGTKQYSKVVDDTVHTLRLGIGYGGLLFERAFVDEQLNYLVGGMFGFGGMGVTVRKTTDASAFVAGDNEGKETGQAGAAFMVLSVHGGLTYSFLPWFHGGLDAGAAAFLSSSGFFNQAETRLTDGFVTFNPQLRLRLVLGNLG